MRDVEVFAASAVAIPAAAFVVATTAGDILTAKLSHRFSKVAIRIKNVHATVAFDTFGVAIKVTQSSPWVEYLATGTTWTTVTAKILFGVGAISTLAAAAEGGLIVNVENAYAVKIQASGNAAESTADADIIGVE